MIREIKSKIYFTSYIPTKGRPKDTSGPIFVRIDKKHGLFVVGKKAVQRLELEKKFIKFSYDSTKKVIGWQTKDAIEQEEIDSKTWKAVKLTKAGVYVHSIQGILDQFAGLKDTSYKCEVLKYREASDILSRDDTYFCVKVGKKYHERN